MLLRLGLCLLLTAPALAQGCPAGAPEQAASRALALQQRLLAASVESMDTSVPASLKPVLHDFKQALSNTVEATMRCSGTADSPAQIEQRLASLLHGNQPARQTTVLPTNDSKERDTGTYGSELHIDVRDLDTLGELAVQLTYGVECGEDNLLFLFQQAPSGWQPTLRWFNPDLNQVSDAFGDLFFVAPVPAPVPAVVVVHGHPWCTSNLSGFEADLLALGDATHPQRVLDHQHHDYRRDGNTEVLTGDYGFEVKTDIDSISGDLVFRPAVLRYDTRAGHLEQLAVAPNAQAFVDLWLMTPWAQAARWSAPANRTALQQGQKDLAEDGDFSLSFGPTRACAGRPGEFQVELRREATHTTPQMQILRNPAAPAFAHLRGDSKVFTMLTLSPKPDPACAGPDLMARPGTHR